MSKVSETFETGKKDEYLIQQDKH